MTTETNTANPASTVILTATYASPTNAPFTVSLPLATPQGGKSIKDQTDYLANLRKSVLSAQEQINKELTARMDEDKSRDAEAAPSPNKKRKPAVDEAEEEQNYGEEVVEEDD